MRQALLHLSQSDRKLAAVIESVGPYAIRYRDADFSTLARSIVYQQLSGKAAATIYGRVEQAVHPNRVCGEAILALSGEQMRALGLSNQKATYLRSIAEQNLNGIIDFERLHELPDHEVIQHLTAAKGVGVWTAQMYLIFALRRPDILPTGDLGIRNAIQRIYHLRTPPKPDRIMKIARPWRPYASVASWYLWRSLDGTATL